LHSLIQKKADCITATGKIVLLYCIYSATRTGRSGTLGSSASQGTHMAPTDQRHEQALKLFLDARPELRESLDHLNPLLAQAKGETPAQYREERLHEAFEAEAENQGLFAWELTLLLTAATPEDYQAQRMEVHREVAEMAHMSWADYCDLYGLEP